MVEHVAEQRVDRRRELGAIARDHMGRTVDVERELTALVVRERRPELHTLAHELGDVARAQTGPHGSPGFVDQLVDDSLELVGISAHTLGAVALGERIGVKPERRERGAQPMGQVGDALALCCEQLLHRPASVLKRPADLGDLLGPVGLDTRIEVALPERRRRARELLRRADDRPRQAIRGDDADDDQPDRDKTERHVRPCDAVGEVALRDEHLDHRRDVVAVVVLAEGDRLVQLDTAVVGSAVKASCSAIASSTSSSRSCGAPDRPAVGQVNRHAVVGTRLGRRRRGSRVVSGRA